ncbi:ubiquitin-conjugating enzyme E2 E2 isoform X2 [Leopardus geoffroyi]|uniref:ubiquitin-conjugating enzyme E2 E2 isoform X2 n=1 Tax=Leopardus geoffroyi TaxID=46844 RepID=UPI001E262F43|nr:ubiquitin-conjugating enzyme E2 E2 isoform X2 [Leopardus geoffroyi]
MSTEAQRVDDSPSTSGGSSDGDQRESVQQEPEREQVQPKKKEGKISSKTAAKLSTSAKRIQKELAEITLDPPPNCSGLPLPPSHPRCEGQESSSADGPSVYHGKIAFGFRACAMPEWQICIHSTWQNLSLALSALLSTRAPWACVTLHLWDEPETKAWESWEPLSLVCKHTRDLARFSAGVASVFLLDKILCDLVKLVFRNCGVHIDREIRS